MDEEKDDYDIFTDPDWLNDRDREWEIETGAQWPVIGEAR